MERRINWGSDASDATYRSGDLDGDGSRYVVAETTDGSGNTVDVLLEWDDTAGEFVYGGPVNMSGNDITNVGSISTEQLNNEIRFREDATGQEVHDVLEAATLGDVAVFPPGFSATVPETITLSDGVSIRAYGKGQTTAPPTLKKGFDGTLLEYGDWFHADGVVFSGNRSAGYGGDVLDAAHADTAEVRINRCRITGGESAGIRTDEIYLSTISNTKIDRNQDGIVVGGADHNPHNLFSQVNITRNDRAGVDLRQTLDGSTFAKCLIQQNLYGFDTERATLGFPYSLTLSSGTLVQRNEGPGIILQGSTAATVGLANTVGTAVQNNNQDPPAGLTSTNGLGDIHAENGGLIRGTVGGFGGEIRRYNTDGRTDTLTISGGAGDVELPDINLIVLNDEKVGSVVANSGIGLDPKSGGQTVTY